MGSLNFGGGGGGGGGVGTLRWGGGGGELELIYWIEPCKVLLRCSLVAGAHTPSVIHE